MILNNDHYTLSDVDECEEGIASCVHNCHNTIGSYTCSCSFLYTLSSNGHNCDATISFAAIVGSVGGFFLIVIFSTLICLIARIYGGKKTSPENCK